MVDSVINMRFTTDVVDEIRSFHFWFFLPEVFPLTGLPEVAIVLFSLHRLMTLLRLMQGSRYGMYLSLTECESSPQRS